MSDLISRQAAIRWVKAECNPYGKPTLDFESGKKVIEHLKQMPSADRPKGMIHIDEVYRLIAGHSNYHGDSILSAFICLVEGKNVKPIAPLDESADRPRIGRWRHVQNGGITPGGTPLYTCENCGGSEHLHGAEYPERKVFCDECGCVNLYPWEKCKEEEE